MHQNPEKPFRCAIIGTGRIGSLLEKDPLRHKPHTHAGWYSALPQTSLVAGVDCDPDRLDTFGRDWGIDSNHLYTDYRQMLETERPDIVSVCAYVADRCAMAKHALECGARGLWLEKAVSTSLTEGYELLESINRYKAHAVVDQPRRADARYRAVRRIIQSGELGKLISIQVSFSGQLIHTGIHAFDVLRFWCKEPEWIMGWLDPGEVKAGDQAKEESPHALQDQGGTALIHYPDNVDVFISALRRDYYIFQFDLQFQKGRIALGNDIEEVLLPGPSKNYQGYEELFSASPHLLQETPGRLPLPDLLHAMGTGEGPLMSLSHSLEAMRLAAAVFQSDSAGGKPISPESVDTHLRILSD